MYVLIIALVSILALVGTFVFSIDRLALSSFSLFTGPIGPIAAFEPRITAFALLASLGLALVLVYRAGISIGSRRASLVAFALALSTTPIVLAPRVIGLGFLAAPLLVFFTHQLATRRYRLISIALPLAALFLLGYGAYPLFVLASLLLTSPLRSDPDPRLGELFLVVALAFVAFDQGGLVSGFSIDRLFRFGLVFVGLAAFAVFRVLARGQESAHPFVALALASAVLHLLGDPLGGLAFTLSATVLIARSFESVFRFFEVSNLSSKRLLSIALVVGAIVLTAGQSALLITTTASERMTPRLADSLSSFDQPVAIDERMAPAFEYYSGYEPVPLASDELRVLKSSVLIIPVLEEIDDRYDAYALERVPGYVDDRCFDVIDHDALVEVRVRCSLS